jgi:hypothetical protein
MLTIYVDGDACPVKEQVYKVAGRPRIDCVSSLGSMTPSTPCAGPIRQKSGRQERRLPGDTVNGRPLPLSPARRPRGGFDGSTASGRQARQVNRHNRGAVHRLPVKQVQHQRDVDRREQSFGGPWLPRLGVTSLG